MMDNAQKMFAGDNVLQSLAAKLVFAGDNQAHIKLVVTENMLQGHGTCHGGVIYTLADAAFGVACNSGESVAVAQHCSISYLKPAMLGDELSIKVTCRSQMGRTGIYDGTVIANGAKTIAEFRGHSRSLPAKK